jgi:hypothetical protein
LSFELVYKVLSKRLRTKAICRSEMKYQYSTISGRSSFPKDVALKMAQARRKRERERVPAQNNNKAKPEQLKPSKTYPSMWS